VAWVVQAPSDGKAWSLEEVVGLHVEHTVRQHVAELLGLQEVHRLLHTVQREAPELATEVSRVIPAQRMAEVLRRLLQEGVPVRNLLLICESLVNWAQKEPDTIALTEQVRIDMGRYITSRYVGPDRQLPAVLFESVLIERIAEAIERSQTGNRLLLSPAATQDIREQMRRIVDSASGRVVAVVSSEVRRYVKTLLGPAIPQMVVLSYQEIDDDVALQPVGWVTNPEAA
jgi:type III secretion protein V